MKIIPNENWENLVTLFDKEMLDRYNFFLFEFGKRLTGYIHSELLDRISRIKGPKDYKKRLVIAEVRDQNGRAWWAIVAKAKTLSQREYDPKRSVLSVVPRYDLDVENPVEEILVQYGPWTPDTLPFIPSLRQAAVVIKKVNDTDSAKVKHKNLSDGNDIQALMEKHDLVYDTRLHVYEKLKVVPDLEIEAMRLEFGLSAEGRAHWRPAIQWGTRLGIEMMGKDKDLLRILTDLKYKGYKATHHAREYLTPSEVKALEKFQNKLRVQLR